MVNGIWFASKLEAARYCELLLLQKAGEIRDLALQARFPMEINGVKICTYVADFCYEERRRKLGGTQWVKVVEDTKGVATSVFRLKAKLMRAILEIDIRIRVDNGHGGTKDPEPRRRRKSIK